MEILLRPRGKSINLTSGCPSWVAGEHLHTPPRTGRAIFTVSGSSQFKGAFRHAATQQVCGKVASGSLDETEPRCQGSVTLRKKP